MIRTPPGNVKRPAKIFFRGLPTPANALAVISVVLAAHHGNSEFITSLASSPPAIITYSLSLSLLMVTRIPLISLKFASFNITNNLPRYILVVLCILLVILLGLGGIIFIVPAYIIVSVIFTILSN